MSIKCQCNGILLTFNRLILQKYCHSIVLSFFFTINYTISLANIKNSYWIWLTAFFFLFHSQSLFQFDKLIFLPLLCSPLSRLRWTINFFCNILSFGRTNEWTNKKKKPKVKRNYCKNENTQKKQLFLWSKKKKKTKNNSLRIGKRMKL